MLLPEAATVFVTVTDASAVRMPRVAVPVTEVAALRLRRHGHNKGKHHRRQENC
jgi:hypothetical protein